MSRYLVIISAFATVLSAQTPGRISGTLKDPSGAAVPGALVSAYQQAKNTDGTFAPVFNGKTGADGSFVLEQVAAGTYVLCAEKADAALLNPCFWSGAPTRVTVPPGGSAAGVSLVADKGVALRIRVNDAKGLLTSNPSLDDLIIAVSSAIGPTLPTQIASKDNAGKTITVSVPQSKPVDIHIRSAKLLLSDDKGKSLATPSSKVTVIAPAAPSEAAQGAAKPDLILNIQGQVQKP